MKRTTGQAARAGSGGEGAAEAEARLRHTRGLPEGGGHHEQAAPATPAPLHVTLVPSFFLSFFLSFFASHPRTWLISFALQGEPAQSQET